MYVNIHHTPIYIYMTKSQSHCEYVIQIRNTNTEYKLLILPIHVTFPTKKGILAINGGALYKIVGLLFTNGTVI